ncbi:hypothetical protein [Enterococcus faecalis]|uniref:hypothetical protein n=1 Tax=Enterococcus faecalis TaxID=1351 RepID=UPI0001E19F6E|nr:hypothetical protein [Enterococcus faecalis]EFM76946.1 hypothetical protein HMPREF9521_01058 [Enterococcus faecalis TX2134]EIQ7102533.1 hypothetical protein [Enterococcus faecalis]EOK04470.1 hypothetical protein WOS_02420 [Enterococcus faecalis EnGen0367]ETU38086.1 hypothetical protein P017_02460 [Enterococcus faecalis EnGen0417]NST77648.1 hypothetical protein [Enterococcus faecalis]
MGKGDVDYRRSALEMTDKEFDELYKLLDTAKTPEEREQLRQEYYQQHKLNQPTLLDRWQADADNYNE